MSITILYVHQCNRLFDKKECFKSLYSCLLNLFFGIIPYRTCHAVILYFIEHIHIFPALYHKMVRAQ